MVTKEQRKIINKRYYDKHREVILLKGKKWRNSNPEKMRELVYRWREENKEQYLENRNKWRLKNKDKENKRSSIWKKNNRDKINPVKRKREQERKKSEPAYNLNWRMSNNILKALKRDKDGYSWEQLVGYTKDDLKQHLESQFINGMNWKEFLKGNIHIDHIIPKSLFKYSSPENREFKQCWALENLQPLWAEENIKKGNKILI